MPLVRILVTGGAGYIGSHVNKMLQDAGYDTVVIDDLSQGNEKAVIEGTFVKGDVGKREDIEEVFKSYRIDAVMHFAASIDVGESVQNPSKYYRNNVCNTLVLLDVMRDYEVDKIVFSSSAAIFGNADVPESGIKEDAPHQPTSPYGWSKLMIEQILKDYDQAYDLRSISLRYFNAAGGDPDGELKNYKEKEHNLIPVILRTLKYQQNPLTIFGHDYPTRDGTCIRDYIHVYDLGKAHIFALEKLLKGGKSTSYNFGNGRGFSVLEVIETVEKILGKKIPYMFGPRRLGDPAILIGNSEKAQKELKWNPKYPKLENIILHAWQALT